MKKQTIHGVTPRTGSSGVEQEGEAPRIGTSWEMGLTAKEERQEDTGRKRGEQGTRMRIIPAPHEGGGVKRST